MQARCAPGKPDADSKINSPPVQAGQRTNGAGSWYHLWFKRASRRAPLHVPSHTPRDIGRTRLALLRGILLWGSGSGRYSARGKRSLAPNSCSLWIPVLLTGFHHSLDHIGVRTVYTTSCGEKSSPCGKKLSGQIPACPRWHKPLRGRNPAPRWEGARSS